MGDRKVVVIASEDEFKKFMQDHKENLIVVDFFATWCGPCKQIAPKVEAFAKSMNDVAFAKVDVDENEELAQQYEVTAMPTFLFFKNGQKVDSFMGANAKQLEDKIQKLK